MTLSMPDSVRVADLPDGYPAYLGYADGNFPTAIPLAARFPHAHRVILTVTGRTLGADGIDCEPGNPNAASAADWARRKLAAQPESRPVIYASVLGPAGFGMGDVLRELAARGIDRGRVRLLSAHYGQGEHICGSRSCGLIGVDMDGTQWTDAFSGVGMGLVDMSVVRDDFFGAAPVPGSSWTERIMQQLPTVRQGMTGEAVRTVQGLILARHQVLAVDGVFGPVTVSAVKSEQQRAGIAVDGVVGPQTWPVLLGIA